MTAEDLIKNIDWEQLKDQKQDLLFVMGFLERNGQTLTADRLNGVLALIDNIQDFAVDKLGIPEDKVFNLEKDEN